MKAILPILKSIGRVGQIIVMISMLGMNGLMGYIMFAPDNLPKPFYLNYQPLAGAPANTSNPHAPKGPTATPRPTVDPSTIYKPGDGVMVDTGTKVINLADPGGRRYLKVTITIEVAPPEGVVLTSTTSTTAATPDPANTAALTAFNDQMNARMPVINDTLTTLLSSKTFDSIYTMDGKEALRTDIQHTLNTRLSGIYVIAVYFTEFVVQ